MGFYYKLFPCMKSLAKELLGFNKLENDSCKIYDALLTIVTLLLIIILLVFLSPWILLNYMIRGYLTLIHGVNYGGLLDMDTPFEHLNPKILLNTVYIVEHNGNKEEFYEEIKKACQKLLESHNKFSSSVQKCLGFYYFLSNRFVLDDIVSSVHIKEDNLTKDALLKYLESHYLSIPDKDDKLWDVKVFNKPIIWGDHSKTYYPVLIRTNHSIADGICLSVFHQKHLLCDVVNTQFEHAVRKANKSTDYLGNVSVHKALVMGKTLDYSNLNSDDDLPGHIAAFVEDEPKYFDIIKKLRIHFKVTFTDIIATAAVSSIADYLTKNDITVGSIMFGNTTRPLTENTEAILSGLVLRNESTLHIAEIPCRSSSTESLTTQLKTVAKVLSNVRNSADGQCVYLLQKITSFLPPSVLAGIIRKNTNGSTLGITNIPAPNFARIQSYPVKDVLIFPSKFGNTKFVMTVHSYGGRLQVVLVSNNGLITTRDNLAKILDGTFKNIDALWKENKEAIERGQNNNQIHFN